MIDDPPLEKRNGKPVAAFEPPASMDDVLSLDASLIEAHAQRELLERLGSRASTSACLAGVFGWPLTVASLILALLSLTVLANGLVATYVGLQPFELLAMTFGLGMAGAIAMVSRSRRQAQSDRYALEVARLRGLIDLGVAYQAEQAGPTNSRS